MRTISLVQTPDLVAPTARKTDLEVKQYKGVDCKLEGKKGIGDPDG